MILVLGYNGVCDARFARRACNDDALGVDVVETRQMSPATSPQHFLEIDDDND